MRMSIARYCFLAVTLLSLAACGARPSVLMVNPVYKAGKQPLPGTWARPGDTVDISIVDGRRSEPGVIGRNIEEDTPVKIVENPQGGSMVLVRGALASELRAAGLVVAEGTPAVHHIQVTLERFWVEEEETYLGEVRLRVVVLDGSGQVKGDALVSGISKRWGRSLSQENYQETFDSALRDAIEKLFQDPRFQGAFGSA